MSNQLVVDGPPGYLALAALLGSYSAIFARGQRAHERLDTGPDRGPHLGHIGRSPLTVKPNILESGEVFELAHNELYLSPGPTTFIKVGNKDGRNFSQCGNVFPRGTDQP